MRGTSLVTPGRSRSGGFTLIELLVVIAVIGILVAFIVPSLSPSNRGAQLDEVANDIEATLRTARQNSLTILEHPERPGTYPSYGVAFETGDQELTLYTDCEIDSDGSNKIAIGDPLVPGDGDDFEAKVNECAGAGILGTVDLKHGATITGIQANIVAGGGLAVVDLEEFYVLFVRPEPTIWFAGKEVMVPGQPEPLDVGEVRITIQSADGANERVVYLNTYGLVHIEMP